MNTWCTNVESLSLEQEKELAIRIHQGDIDAKNQLIEANINLAKYIANLYMNSNSYFTYDDLVSEAIIGMSEAAAKFDPTKGAKFSTYATWWIKKQLQFTITEQNHPMRIPINVSKYKKRIKQFIIEYKEEYGYTPCTEEIHKEFPKLSEACISNLVQTLNVVYIDSPISQDDMTSNGEIIPDDNVISPITNAIQNDLTDVVLCSLDCLNEREKYIIRKRYGIGYDNISTLETLSAEFNLNKERIRQIQIGALRKLKKEIQKI